MRKYIDRIVANAQVKGQGRLFRVFGITSEGKAVRIESQDCVIPQIDITNPIYKGFVRVVIESNNWPVADIALPVS